MYSQKTWSNFGKKNKQNKKLSNFIKTCVAYNTGTVDPIRADDINAPEAEKRRD